jgi:UDP-N-acetylglucosamine/UDP-N-acetylgalactosamine diphosphorylase
MDFQPKSYEKIRQLNDKGVDIRNPGTLDIGNEVNIDRISKEDVTIYPGCRIYGGKTVISSGCRLGYEAPVTIEDCQLGSKVALKGGFASKSVFLEKANMSLGAHVREGCILEEEASGAHCVGLKQTILFPFVTLGSLVNFCDCLMAGGTSRSNHSEVGSSYIHFNFTPDADKTTPSLLGDVPRGVMLNHPPIFLGGQGGIVGPLRLGYGNVVAAGTILRQDYPQDNQLIFDTPRSGGVRNFIPGAYPQLQRLPENNVLYLANLRALEAWYKNVRKTFFATQEFGAFLYEGAMDVLSLARKERLKRLRIMAQKAAAPSPKINPELNAVRQAFHEHVEKIEMVLNEPLPDDATKQNRESFLSSFAQSGGDGREPYIETIRNLSPDVSAKGEKWLRGIVDYYCQRIAAVIASLSLFRTI